MADSNVLANTKIVDNNGDPLAVYHGSNTRFQDFRGPGPFYFTPMAEYGYIQNSEVVYPVYLDIKKPYYVNQQSDIERLRSFPERVRQLVDEGYDGAIYAQRNNIMRGVTGWGNDYSQIVCFDASQIHSVFERKEDLAPRGRKKPYLSDDYGESLKLYHATNQYFTDFEQTSDIGFHFGTLKAASDRMRRIPVPEVSVERISPSPIALEALRLQKAPIKDLADRAYYLLFTRLDSPRNELRQIVDSMPSNELEEIIEQYRLNPPSENYNRRLEEANKGQYYLVTVNGDTVAEEDDRIDALKAAAMAKKSFLKEVRLRADNPLRLPDLGVWSPELIATSAGLAPDEIDEVINLEDNVLRYERLRDILLSKGYDCIVYKNEVEDKGSDSYIALDPRSIEIVNNDLIAEREVAPTA